MAKRETLADAVVRVDVRCLEGVTAEQMDDIKQAVSDAEPGLRAKHAAIQDMLYRKYAIFNDAVGLRNKIIQEMRANT